MTLALDRQGMIDIITRGKAGIGGAMMPLPEGAWGMPKEMVIALPGYGGEMARAAGRGAQDHGGPGLRPRQAAEGQGVDARLPGLQGPGRPAGRSAEQDLLRRRTRDHRVLALVRPRDPRGLRGRAQPHRFGVDDPDVTLAENYSLQVGAQLHEILQSAGGKADRASNRRKPISPNASGSSGRSRKSWPRTRRGRSSSTAVAATCWHPHLKGHVLHENSIYNNWRFESVWLDK